MTEHEPRHICPQCHKDTLQVQPLPGGSTERMCVDLDCDFSETLADGGSSGTDESFEIRVRRLSDDRLCDMVDHLRRSVETLSGRGQSISRRQLAVIRAELERRRSEKPRPTPGEASTCVSSGNRRSSKAKVPAQLNTPEVRTRRLRGIRAYHHRRQGEDTQAQASSAEVGVSAGALLSDIWFATLTRTLEQEADRHERAARDFARAPELFALHIDHSARAFELKRVVDLLRSYSELG